MKEVLLITPYYYFPGEGVYRRFRYLCELMSSEGLSVRLITSNFVHLKKQHRNLTTEELEQYPYKVKLIKEPGYKKNIDVRRIYSHHVFAKNLEKYLDTIDDSIGVVYCAVPTPDAAIVAGKFAKSKNIPFIIDVQDTWPEAMKLVFNTPVLSDLLFLPLKVSSDTAYSMADSIVAVSDTYLERALKSNKRSKSNLTVYIGTDLEYFDKGVQENYDKVNKLQSEFWVTYIGALGTSYDIKTLISAIGILHDKGLTNIRLMILGDGPLRDEFESFALQNKVDAAFTGMVPYDLMVAYLKKSDIVANAIRKDAPQSITNKIGDFLSSGKPVINGSKNEEFMKMVEKYKIGYNYEPENAENMAEVIEKLYRNEHDREKMGENARCLAEERFDRKKTYIKIIDLIKNAM